MQASYAVANYLWHHLVAWSDDGLLMGFAFFLLLLP